MWPAAWNSYVLGRAIAHKHEHIVKLLLSDKKEGAANPNDVVWSFFEALYNRRYGIRKLLLEWENSETGEVFESWKHQNTALGIAILTDAVSVILFLNRQPDAGRIKTRIYSNFGDLHKTCNTHVLRFFVGSST